MEECDIIEWIEPFVPWDLPLQIIISTALMFFGTALGMIIGG